MLDRPGFVAEAVQRKRLSLACTGIHDAVKLFAGDRTAQMREAIELFLHREPVVFVPPVLDQVAQYAVVHSL